MSQIHVWVTNCVLEQGFAAHFSGSLLRLSLFLPMVIFTASHTRLCHAFPSTLDKECLCENILFSISHHPLNRHSFMSSLCEEIQCSYSNPYKSEKIQYLITASLKTNKWQLDQWYNYETYWIKLPELYIQSASLLFWFFSFFASFDKFH